MKSVFITGTDTGVGKTVLAAGLIAVARLQGADAVPMKPVQTGCRWSGERLVPPDLEFCLKYAGLMPSPEETEWMCPNCFEPACSPHLAASLSGRAISLEGMKASFLRLAGKHEAVVVEGAGGLLVPIGGGLTMLDVARAFRLPMLIAARPGLGTLNHTQLTLWALREAGLDIAGVVLVESRCAAWGLIEEDNFDTIRKTAGVPLVLRLPYVQGLAEGVLSAAAFLAAVAPHLSRLVEYLRSK